MAVFQSQIKSPWASTGAAVGQGLAGGLRTLAEGKLKKLQDRHEETELQSAGLTPEEALLIRKFGSNPAAQQKMLAQFLSQERGQQGQPSPEESLAQPEAIEDVLNSTQRSRRSSSENPTGLEQQLQAAIQSGSAKNLSLQDVLGLLAGKGTGQQQRMEPEANQEPIQAETETSADVLAPTERVKKGSKEITSKFKEPAGNRPTINAKGAGTTNQTQQRAIDSSLKAWNTRLDQAKVPAEQLYDSAKHMIQLLKSGQVTSGLSGIREDIPVIGKSGILGLSNESVQFSQNADDVAALLSSGPGQGVQTISKIKFNQQRKPNLKQSPQVQKERTYDIAKQAQRVLLKDDIRNALVERNDNQQTANLDKIVDKEYDRIEKFLNTLYKQHDPYELEEGTEITDDKTGQAYAIVRDNLWWPIL